MVWHDWSNIISPTRMIQHSNKHSKCVDDFSNGTFPCQRIEIDIGREDDDVENVRDVGHINELIKRRCTSTKTENGNVDCSNPRGIS